MDINSKNRFINKVLTLQRESKKKEAINLLNSYINNNPEDRDAISLIGIILVDNNEFKKAIPYLEKSILLKSYSELVYLSIYIAYVKLNKFSKAIDVLGNYLDRKPANLFKDTLKELLIDLSNGYALAYKDKIIHYAKKNNISIPPNIP